MYGCDCARGNNYPPTMLSGIIGKEESQGMEPHGLPTHTYNARRGGGGGGGNPIPIT